MTPKLLALDMMDTVVRDPVFHDVPRRLGLSQPELFQLLDGPAWVEFETGRIDEPVYLGRMFSGTPPAGVTSRDVRDTIVGGYRLIDGLEALLTELRDRGARVWVLSNYSPWMVELRRKLSLDRFFEDYVVSYETGFRKPDPRAYEPLLQRAGVSAGECLFVDDREQNVEAARGLGIQAVVFEEAGQLRGELARLGLL